MTETPSRRCDVPLEDTWDLTPMYDSDRHWAEALEEASSLPPQASRWRGALGTSPEKMEAALAEILRAYRTVEKLYVYAHLRQDQDLSDSAAVEMFEKAAALNAKLTAETSFLAPEILAIPQDTMDRWLLLDLLTPYRTWLEEILRAGPHTLDAPREELLARASEVARCFSGASGKLTNVEMPARLPDVADDEGSRVKLTNSSFIRLLTEGSREVRRNAYQSFYRELAGNAATLAALLEGQVKAHVFNARARNFPSALEASLFNDRVGRGVYRELISSVHRNLPALHRYYRLKKNILGVDRLAMYDLYAPIACEYPRRYTFMEAADLTLDAVKPLGDVYGKTLARGIENRWIDRYENVGKRSGAYSSGCYDSAPYILLNFTGTLDSVFTLAHEAGHSMHSHFSRKTRSYQESDYPILLAEVASITNEVLLFESLVKKASGPAELVPVLDHLVNGFRSTLFRQAMFAEFELLIHEHVEADGVLTPDFLRESYYTLVRTYHGDAFAWDDTDAMIGSEWARVPHFYYNFYVYKYATGMASAMAAGEAVLRGPGGYVDRYIEFLGGGRSRPPLDQLRGIDIDLETPEPVDIAAAGFTRTVALLEEALGKKG
jgi:oligoendopeptidase F